MVTEEELMRPYTGGNAPLPPLAYMPDVKLSVFLNRDGEEALADAIERWLWEVEE